MARTTRSDGRASGHAPDRSATSIPDPRTTPRLDMTEVARLYGIGLRQAYAAAAAGEIPAKKIGGSWVVPTALVLRDLGLDGLVGEVAS